MRLRRFPIPFSAKLLLPTVVLLIALIAGAWLILAIHGQRAAELASRTQVQSAEQALRLFFSAQSQRLSALATPTTPSVQEPGVWRGRLATDLTPLSDVPEDVQEVLAVFRRIAPHLTMTQGIAFPMVANGKLYAVWARQDATGESGQAVIRVAMTSIQPAFDNLLLHWPSIQASLLGLHPLSKEWELWVAPPSPARTLADLPNSLRNWLAAPTPPQPRTWVGEDGTESDLCFDVGMPTGAGRLVVWLRTTGSPTQVAWRHASHLVVILLLLGTALLAAHLWHVAAFQRRALVQLGHWAHRSTKDEFPEVPAIDGSGEIRQLAALLSQLQHYYQNREAEIRQTAFRDNLTHLPNRAHLRIRLNRDIRYAQEKNRTGALLTLDVQRFKQVNLVLGPASGDLLLRKMGQRLASTLPDKRCMLSRTGGNQFACLIPYCDEANALIMAKRLLKAMDEPFDIEGQAIDLMAQVGLALFPRDGVNADEVLSHAESALTAARKEFQSVRVYEPSMTAASEASLSLMSELKQALEHNEFKLYLQPKVRLSTKEVIGAEALIRWPHASRGMVPPDHFIPFAEQTGFIRALSMWVVEQSAIIWKELHATGLTMKLSVNLSTRDLMDKALPDKLQAIVSRHGVPRGSIVLEITESATMDDPQHAQQILTRLHEMGFLLSIDDFGTGYSSLAYLKALPVHELKIDRSFVMNMESDLDDAKIVRSTIDLAHNLGMTVVAEGLESDKAWKLLDGLQCDEAQGYFIHRPMPVEEFADWVRGWTAPNLQNVHLNTDFNNLV